MYSGLLPKGLSEAELSSDDSDTCAGDRDDDATEDNVRECKQNANVNALVSSETSATHGETLEFVDNTGPSHSSNACLPGISEEMWNKFKHLQKQKDDQKGELPSTKRKRKRRAKRKSSDPHNKESNQVEEVHAPEKHLEGLKQYFGINDRFEPPACSRPPPKSGLEKTIESAIEAGDFEKAEELSDRLATRELGVKIKNAVDCRDFVQANQEMEASKAAQKRKKTLVWGFEAKRRWETKSNMGYM
ncbi:protein FAM204A [Sardina pilchardus]|uniref:protein FAM204A n=1 Tax=Sardina pilchardus TaxID=27697 RepID=UPI002E140595